MQVIIKYKNFVNLFIFKQNPLFSLSVISSNAVYLNNEIKKLKRTQEEIINLLNEKFAVQTDAIVDLASSIKCILRKQRRIVYDENFIEIVFPFKTKEEFIKFDKSLQNNKFLDQIVSLKKNNHKSF